jgi:ATP-grasp domain, R2K clade family 2
MLLILTENHEIKSSSAMLGNAAKAFGWDVYNSIGWRCPFEKLGTQGAIYGRPLFAAVAANQMLWQLISPDPEWISKVPLEFLHRKIEVMTVDDARKNITTASFIEPINNDCFNGAIYSSGLAIPNNSSIEKKAKVLVSGIMPFTSKYRCFIKNNKVATASCFFYNKIDDNKLSNKKDLYSRKQDEAISFANKVLKNSPPIECDAFVMDVARYERAANDWPFVLYKVRPAWSSEIYGCEIAAAFDTITSSVKDLFPGK